MFVEAKVFSLGKIAENLRKKVTDLEAQVKPSTPPKVLEERRKVENEAITRIEESEELCAKEIDRVSHPWEYLIDEELEKLTK